MKKKALLAAAALAALMVPQVAGAEGFGIVQWSAEGVAMGGARMFAENDVSMIASNPAAMTKFSGTGVGVHATYISPHGQYEAKTETGNVHGVNKIHPGIVPGTYFVRQMTEKDWFGIGAYTRYGMVSGMQPGSVGASNNLFAKMNGLSITPTYAHKFDKKWSAAVSAEINYVGLEMNQDFSSLKGKAMMAAGAAQQCKDAATAYAAAGNMELAKAYGEKAKEYAGAATQLGGLSTARTQLKGDSYALGWNAAVNYTFDDKNDIGLVYRSKVKHSLEADFKVYSKMPGMSSKSGDAYGEVMLPDQWTIGYNHKFDNKNRVELNATRTNWHTYKSLDIYVSGVKGPFGDAMNTVHPNYKGYRDTWRYAIGYEHKFSDKYTGMLGFSWDDHAIPENGGDFIVPTGMRRTYSMGVQYHDKKQTAALALGWEKIGDLTFNSGSATDAYKRVHTHNNYAKIISVGYSYKF